MTRSAFDGSIDEVLISRFVFLATFFDHHLSPPRLGHGDGLTDQVSRCASTIAVTVVRLLLTNALSRCVGIDDSTFESLW